ncbi:FtsX-like permease family protein [Hazenella coriacea]|uniref:Putative ABC transport system permease protein n=1 Tax=Hazenella coriacea TaxID=1179467 RepID=A0A4R3LBA3_9BACL|nr:ABC transporter permease [Hazenella coriacea]TCS96568.1 putative ABC transport system permease protein [Hazenella coriacea]
MTFRSIALKNLLFHARSYAAYFLSCCFTIWVFFLYTSLLSHPILQEEAIPNQAIILLYFVVIIIGVFSVLFIGYSQSAFLRQRKQDLGLLQLLGMKTRQVTRLLFWENMIMGSFALVTGIGFGLLFSKLFFLGISAVLQLSEPIPFHFSISPILITMIFFYVLFSLLSWRSRFTIRKLSIADLFRETVQDKPAPRSSIWLVLLAIGCLASAYLLAWDVPLSSLIYRILPILILTLIGTYLTFTQVSVAVINQLEKSPSFIYHGHRLLLFSQLRYRLTDHARILFIVSILCAVVITSISVCVTYYTQAEQAAEEQMPYALSLEGAPTGLTTEQIKTDLQKHHVPIQDEIHFPLLHATVQSSFANEITLISLSDYNQLLRNRKYPAIQLNPNEVVLAVSSGFFKSETISVPKETISIQIADSSIQKQLQRRINHVTFNEHDSTRMMLIVEDHQFKQWKKTAPPSQLTQMHAYVITDWKQTEELMKQWEQQIISQQGNIQQFKGTILLYQLLKELFAPLMFISLFIGILFFLAAGSLLYFRCFTELAYDQKQMRILQKIGLTVHDAKRILKAQIRILFFLPMAIGLIHSAIALNMFSFMFQQPVWTVYIGVVTIYLLIYGVYYYWTSYSYSRSVIQTTPPSFN